jgi:hypothetical protein
MFFTRKPREAEAPVVSKGIIIPSVIIVPSDFLNSTWANEFRNKKLNNKE